MHPSPRYGLHLGLPAGIAEAIDWGDEIDEADALHEEFPDLASDGVGTEDLDAARQHYQAATAFIPKLSVYRPSFIGESTK